MSLIDIFFPKKKETLFEVGDCVATEVDRGIAFVMHEPTKEGVFKVSYTADGYNTLRDVYWLMYNGEELDTNAHNWDWFVADKYEIKRDGVWVTSPKYVVFYLKGEEVFTVPFHRNLTREAKVRYEEQKQYENAMEEKKAIKEQYKDLLN